MDLKNLDKENDILNLHFGKQTKYSAELFSGKLILDFDEEDNIVGIEIFDFMKQVKKHDENIKRIFQKAKEEN